MAPGTSLHMEIPVVLPTPLQGLPLGYVPMLPHLELQPHIAWPCPWEALRDPTLSRYTLGGPLHGALQRAAQDLAMLTSVCLTVKWAASLPVQLG